MEKGGSTFESTGERPQHLPRPWVLSLGSDVTDKLLKIHTELITHAFFWGEVT